MQWKWNCCVISEAFLAAKVVTAVQDLTQCSLIGIWRNFGGNCCLRLQGGSNINMDRGFSQTLVAWRHTLEDIVVSVDIDVRWLFRLMFHLTLQQFPFVRILKLLKRIGRTTCDHILLSNPWVMKSLLTSVPLEWLLYPAVLLAPWLLCCCTLCNRHYVSLVYALSSGFNELIPVSSGVIIKYISWTHLHLYDHFILGPTWPPWLNLVDQLPWTLASFLTYFLWALNDWLDSYDYFFL